jgi:hypothetical protein
MDRKAQSTISRWSIAAAIFGGICNLLSWVLENYQYYYLEHVRIIWDLWLIIPATVSLLPLVVLVVLRHRPSVVFTYASVLFLILVWRVQHLVPYKFLWVGAVSYKIDQPGLLESLLGAISAVVLLVRAAIRFAAFIRRTQRPSSKRSPDERSDIRGGS